MTFSKIYVVILNFGKKCLNKQACINDIMIKLYDDNGFLVENIILTKDQKGIIHLLLLFLFFQWSKTHELKN